MGHTDRGEPDAKTISVILDRTPFLSGWSARSATRHRHLPRLAFGYATPYLLGRPGRICSQDSLLIVAPRAHPPKPPKKAPMSNPWPARSAGLN